MAKVKVVVNPKAVRDILRGREMQADLERRARRISTAAGPGHRVESNVGRNRARAVVITETYEAMRREATRRSLSRALDAGRG